MCMIGVEFMQMDTSANVKGKAAIPLFSLLVTSQSESDAFIWQTFIILYTSTNEFMHVLLILSTLAPPPKQVRH